MKILSFFHGNLCYVKEDLWKHEIKLNPVRFERSYLCYEPLPFISIKMCEDGEIAELKNHKCMCLFQVVFLT